MPLPVSSASTSKVQQINDSNSTPTSNKTMGVSNTDEEPLTHQQIQQIRESAAQGVAESQYKLGDMYRKGDGVSRNLQEALKWYHAAANQGHAKANEAKQRLMDNLK